VGLKLISENGRDVPVILCDICGSRMNDMFDDKVSGTRGTLESPGNLVFHHKNCATAEPLSTTLEYFFAMLLGRNRIGSIGQNEAMDTVSVKMPTAEDFE